ncbi:hypothetical protein J4E86_005552 [Alternaria arbusti]|uniref:uncharacterized protein n=1 Tax=Alternaria arbusti TaxID=232088 RepID=UPI00222110A6|nr:uncharacterized protein J4E86_005552 [Alternaria arbusti]KAI4957079.1 hypothetical protein J4E86_005552 [Alternaria arbusti]
MSTSAIPRSKSNFLMLGDETYILQKIDRGARTGKLRDRNSELLRFKDPSLRRMKQFVYDPLPPKMIRLMRLYGGSRDDSIKCELFEAAYDNSFHIPTHVARKGGLPKVREIERSQTSAERELEEVKEFLKVLTKKMEVKGQALDGTWRIVEHMRQTANGVWQTANDAWYTRALDEERDSLKSRFEKLKQTILEEELETVGKIEIEYEALSWCWGSAISEYAVSVTKEDEDYKMPVRKDLALALKYLRHQGKPRILWIDAICIDQENDVERNQQVQMMSRVYTRAANVCIWLGQQDDESEVAFKFIKEEITHLKDFDSISSDKDYSTKKAEIWCGPDSMPWKEFAVAVELFVEVENATHRLSEVMQMDVQFRHVPGWFEGVSHLGASLLVQATGKVFRSYGTPMDKNEVHDKNTDENMTDEQRTADEERDKKKAADEKHKDRADLLDKIQTIDPLDRRSLLSLEYLVTTMFIFKASECRDSALDILCRPWALEPQRGGSARVKKRKSPPTDRNGKGAKRTCVRCEARQEEQDLQDYWEKDISSDKSREIWWRELRDKLWEHSLRRKEEEKKALMEEMTTVRDSRETKEKECDDDMEQSKDIDLPSWVPRAKNAPFEIYRHPGIDIAKTGRANADPLVGWPQDGHRNYSAAQTEAVKFDYLKFRKRSYMGHYSLYVTGFKVDEVDEVRDASQGGSIPNSWLELSGWEPPYTQDPPSAFWRTIVADRGSDNRNPPYYYARACRESVGKGGRESGSVNTTDLINNERNSIIAEFCRRVHAVIWGRSLFRTKQGKQLGLGKDVQKGDLVCILHGCTVPVILRAQKKNEGDKAKESFEDSYEAVKSCIKRLDKISVCRARYEKQKEKYKKQGHSTSDSNWEQDVKSAHKKVNYILGKDKDRRKASAQRETTKQRFKPDEDNFYVFKGESYVHGCMDGEAVRDRFYGTEQEWVYELR